MVAKKAVKKSTGKVVPNKATKVKVVSKKNVAAKKTVIKKKVLVKAVVKKVIKKKVDWKPKGYHAVTPYMIVSPAADAISFYKDVFGAKVMSSMVMPNGQVAHAELIIGDSHLMLADACAEMNALGPESYGGSPVSMHLYVKDAHAIFNAAVKAGATILEPIEDKFYGDRHGLLLDPFGHTWCIATHIENVSPAQMKKRMASFQNE